MNQSTHQNTDSQDEQTARSACAKNAGTRRANPLASLPELHIVSHQGYIPDAEGCRALWDKYGMLDNVRAHSALVARVAAYLAERAYSLGFAVSVPEVRAAGLLHDIAKTYCIRNGGGHAQLGAAWVVHETGCRAIAQGVLHHVCWPWPLRDDPYSVCILPLFVLYADKRARHDTFVTLEERFSDLLVRYGVNEQSKATIRSAHQQGLELETLLSKHLKTDLSGLRIDASGFFEQAR